MSDKMKVSDLSRELANRLHRNSCVVTFHGCDCDVNCEVEDSFVNRIIFGYGSDYSAIIKIVCGDPNNSTNAVVHVRDVRRIEIYVVLFELKWYKTVLREMVSMASNVVRGARTTDIGFLLAEVIEEAITTDDAEAVRNVLYCNIEQYIKEYNRLLPGVTVYTHRVHSYETSGERKIIDESCDTLYKELFDSWFYKADVYDAIECKVVLLQYKRDKLGWNPDTTRLELGL